MIQNDIALVRIANLKVSKSQSKPELVHDSGFVRIYQVCNVDSRDYYAVKSDQAIYVVSQQNEWLAKDERYTGICAEMNRRSIKNLPGKSSNLRFKILSVLGNVLK